MTRSQLIVVAKAPVAGGVKTRLCPPCTPAQAAHIAAAALHDTLAAVARVPADLHTLLLDGCYEPPAGWRTVAQRGCGLAERLAHGFADATTPDTVNLLVGMDTPQLDPTVLADALAGLAAGRTDAAFGLAEDGGWWALGLGEPAHAALLLDVPMSTSRTGALTGAALRRRGLRIATMPMLRDVDTADDAWAVARSCRPSSRFAQAVGIHLPQPVRR